MYAHSNELEEIGVVNLSGVNVESDPQKEMLLGVRVQLDIESAELTFAAETFLVHSFHSVQLVRTRSPKPERTAAMDAQTGPYTFANYLMMQGCVFYSRLFGVLFLSVHRIYTAFLLFLYAVLDVFFSCTNRFPFLQRNELSRAYFRIRTHPSEIQIEYLIICIPSVAVVG